MPSAQRRWVTDAIHTLETEMKRSTETPLRVFPLPEEWEIDLYFKDESMHPTGSLKHRLAHSLMLFGLVNGDIDENTTLVEASSGSTAVSEAYFAQLLGLSFVAVVPTSTSPSKLALIEQHGGRCEFVNDATALYAEAERLGARPGWYYLDQFSRASSATDWRAHGNVAYAIFDQLRGRRHPEPAWIVVGAGTGGTSATIGRFCRYHRAQTRVAVVDPEGSAFFSAWQENRRDVTARGSRIEGIGRPRVEPSFIPTVIDEMIQVPDAASLSAMNLFEHVMGDSVGPSTGTNLYGALCLVARMQVAGETGSVVTLICDSGTRYLETYQSDAWVAQQGLSLAPHDRALKQFLDTGVWSEASALVVADSLP